MPPHYKGTLITNKNFFKIGPEGEDLNPENVDKSTSYRVKPTALDIIWGNDSRYWRVKDDKAELLQVCWLEVYGSIPLEHLKANGYKISFQISKKPDAFGWDNSPIYLMARVGTNAPIWKKYDVTNLKDGSPSLIPGDLIITVQKEGVQLKADEKLCFGLYEIWKGRWKGGLVIHNVEIRPL